MSDEQDIVERLELRSKMVLTESGVEFAVGNLEQCDQRNEDCIIFREAASEISRLRTKAGEG